MRRLFTACTLTCVAVALGAFCPPQSAFGQGCPGSGQQSVGPDVIVGRIAQIQSGQEIVNYTSTGGMESCSFGTTSCNMGDATLSWVSGNANHPVIGQNVFRLKPVNGSNRFEQIGQSWLKHGFTALQQTACCSPCQTSGTGSALGRGCSDPYTASRNGGQTSAGPKYAVNPTTGVHTHPTGAPATGGSTVARRLQIATGDLEVSDFSGSTKYFGECQYVAADDAANGHKNNNASYRPMTVSGSGSVWTFGVTGTSPDIETRRMAPGIEAWKEFDGNVTLTYVTTPEDANADPDLMVALVIVGVSVTDLGNDVWHYEYAVQNLNSDRSICSFSVPLPNYVRVIPGSVGFHDVNYHSGDGDGWVNRDGTDWPVTISPTSITWALSQTFAQNSNANAIRWGTLYNFRFDANAGPEEGTKLTLGQFKTNPINLLEPTNLGPGQVACMKGDTNGNGLVDGDDIAQFAQAFVTDTGTANALCASDVEASPDGSVDVDDVEPFIDCLLAGGCP
jgi:hypothetical protein